MQKVGEYMNKKRNIQNIIISIIIILQPIIAQITAITVKYSLSSITAGMLFNGLIMVSSIIYVLFFSKSKYKKISVIFLLILFMFFLMFFIVKYNSLSLGYIKREAVFMFKYWFFPISLIGLVNFLSSNKINKIKIENSVKISMIIYCSLIIIAELTGTSNLSYQNSYSGKIGWFYSANEVGTLLVILLPYVFLNFKNNKVINSVFILLSIIAVLFIGTKTSFVGMLLLIITIIVYFIIKLEKKKKALLIISSSFVLLFIILINPPALRNMKQSFNYYNSYSKVENKNVVPKNASLSFLVFSERNGFFRNAVLEYKNTSILNKTLGIGFTNNNSKKNYQNHLVEMDYFDLLFKYGVIGLLIYILPTIYIVYRIIKYLIKCRFNVTFSDIIYIYIILIANTISFLAGHVLGSPSVSIFLAITMSLMINNLDRS